MGIIVMALRYEAKQGDCISSIAFAHGFFVDTIWNHSNNNDLKQKRKDPNTLCAGDVVFIPDKQEKVEDRNTGSVHRFKLHTTPALCSLQLFDEDEYRSNQDFELEIDGVIQTGRTDYQGVLRVSMLPSARRGKLVIGPDRAEFEVEFGQIEPPTEIRGIQARLNNLGFECANTGKLDDETNRALFNFQRANGLEKTGEIDDATRQKLDELHDNVCDIPNRTEVKEEAEDESDDKSESDETGEEKENGQINGG